MARRIDVRTWQQYQSLRDGGMSRKDAAWKVGISYESATKFDHGEVATPEAERVMRAVKVIEKVERDTIPPMSFEELSNVAQEAVHDFDLFRRRYFGRDSKPWQAEAARIVVELEATELREWVVCNMPPGSGKSTTFTHDIPAWLIVRGRAMRGYAPRCLLGSRTGNQAKMYGRRLRASFMRKRPVEHADATLLHEFGQFQPDEPGLWRSEEFIVWENPDVMPTDEKEPTVMCVGMDTGFLGGRFDFVAWDDLVDKTTMRTEQAIEGQRTWWDDEAETRLEPGGLYMLLGQRLGPDDLYRYALKKPAVDERGEIVDGKAKYRHVVFAGHDEEKCVGDHSMDSPPWPDGCLLDPVRLPWRDLMQIKANDPRKFDIIIQQRDVDEQGVLVPQVFIDGGEWNGRDLPGCLDLERSVCQLDLHHDRLISAISVDPSPTKFWSVQWWIHDPDTNLRWLMDLERVVMDAPDFLDRDDRGRYTGIAHDWVQRAQELGWPIGSMIVEQNAAQRFLLQYDHVKQWTMSNGLSIIPHNTGVQNKTSEEFGVQTLRPQYMYGRVRIPYADPHTRSRVQPLIDEVTKWPLGAYDDCVMAEWMFEWNLPNLTAANVKVPKRSVPSWL